MRLRSECNNKSRHLQGASLADGVGNAVAVFRDNLSSGNWTQAGHSVQDLTATAHMFQQYNGSVPPGHLSEDFHPGTENRDGAINNTTQLLLYRQFGGLGNTYIPEFALNTAGGGILRISNVDSSYRLEDASGSVLVSGGGRTTSLGGSPLSASSTSGSFK